MSSSFGDDLDTFKDKSGIKSDTQLSEESGVSGYAISRLRYGDRLSGKKVATGLPEKLSSIIRVFIRRGGITSPTVVEGWLLKLPGRCLDGEEYTRIVDEAAKELAATKAAVNQTKETPGTDVTPSREERVQAYENDRAGMIAVEPETLRLWKGTLSQILAEMDKVLQD